jgi:Domain of unknown function (DUF4249)
MTIKYHNHKNKYHIQPGSYGLLLLLFVFSCQDKYMPKINVPPSGFLVVEGFINAGNGPTRISLTRASSLDSPAIIQELGAAVDVQSQNGASFPLTQDSTGSYSIPQIPVDNAQQYRLHIKTSNGKEYLSAYSPVNMSPPIDSVTWTAGSDAVSIFVTTHDPQNKVQYYQWQFEETWKYTAEYQSNLKYVIGTGIVLRPPDELFYTCWRSEPSTVVDIATSATLSSALIYEFPVTQVPYFTSDKLVNRYSILVKQYALTKEWYEWQLKVQKNTERVGSIFDSQPSETGGNIVCTTNPAEMVIGFIGCSSETEKRIFIDRTQIPPVKVFTGYEACEESGVGLDSTALYNFFAGGFYIPIDFVYKNGILVGYSAAGPECVDCRLKGGTTTEPSFWQ